MQERTALAHTVLALASACLGMGSHLQALVPSDPEQRCAALLLFYQSLFGVLLPLLLIVPSRQHRGGDRTTSAAGTAYASVGPRLSKLMGQLQRRMEAGLGMLMPCPEQQAVGGTGLALRWGLLLVVLWSACCLVEGTP